MYCNIVLTYTFENLFLLKRETLYSLYNNTVKASTEYHQLTEVTAQHTIESELPLQVFEGCYLFERG